MKGGSDQGNFKVMNAYVKFNAKKLYSKLLRCTGVNYCTMCRAMCVSYDIFHVCSFYNKWFYKSENFILNFHYAVNIKA